MLLLTSEHFAKQGFGTNDVHLTGCSCTAETRAEMLQKHAWKITEVHPAILHHRLFGVF